MVGLKQCQIVATVDAVVPPQLWCAQLGAAFIFFYSTWFAGGATEPEREGVPQPLRLLHSHLLLPQPGGEEHLE